MLIYSWITSLAYEGRTRGWGSLYSRSPSGRELVWFRQGRSRIQDICNVAELEHKTAKKQNHMHMLFGIGAGKLHTARRVRLVMWLTIMQEWVGIAGVTIYSPTNFRIAGISNSKVGWISGINTITYTLSTLICVFTLDRIGRRTTLYWGSIGQGMTMFLAAGFSRIVINANNVGDTM